MRVRQLLKANKYSQCIFPMLYLCPIFAFYPLEHIKYISNSLQIQHKYLQFSNNIYKVIQVVQKYLSFFLMKFKLNIDI